MAAFSFLRSLPVIRPVNQQMPKVKSFTHPSYGIFPQIWHLKNEEILTLEYIFAFDELFLTNLVG
jgi:hypothetical protein